MAVRAADHKDPFDHLILAQAKAENATLVTGDRRMLGYGLRSVRAN
ncbi:MAG: PIN domain-containing protein [Novosphingobium sp.]